MRLPWVNGVPANNVAGWSGTNWFALGSGLARAAGAYVQVMDLLIWKHDLIVGGFFDSAGGKSSKNFAIWHPVALQCAPSGGTMQLSWPAFATNYVLESNSEFATAGWQALFPAPETNSYAVPVSESNRFFRLRQR